MIRIISNGNRTEWSPVRSVIKRVINKIGRPRSGSPICLNITSMIIMIIITTSPEVLRYFKNNLSRKIGEEDSLAVKPVCVGKKAI